MPRNMSQNMSMEIYNDKYVTTKRSYIRIVM